MKALATQLDFHSAKTLVLVNNGLGSEVDAVIANLKASVTGKGQVKVISGELGLRDECKQSLRGTSNCFAAVVFEGTPGKGGRWNYTIRGDSALSNGRVNVKKTNNNPQE